jgi:hypothetical protein
MFSFIFDFLHTKIFEANIDESLDDSVSKAMDCRLGGLNPGRDNRFFSSIASRPALGPTPPHI